MAESAKRGDTAMPLLSLLFGRLYFKKKLDLNYGVGLCGIYLEHYPLITFQIHSMNSAKKPVTYLLSP